MHYHLITVIIGIARIWCKSGLVELLIMGIQCIQPIYELFQSGEDFDLLVIAVLIHQLSNVFLQDFRRIFQAI